MIRWENSENDIVSIYYEDDDDMQRNINRNLVEDWQHYSQQLTSRASVGNTSKGDSEDDSWLHTRRRGNWGDEKAKKVLKPPSILDSADAYTDDGIIHKFPVGKTPKFTASPTSEGRPPNNYLLPVVLVYEER